MKSLPQIITIMLILILLLTNFSTTAMKNKSSEPKQNIPERDEIKDATSDISYDLLIIAPQMFSKYLLPLVSHKNEHDMKTILVEVKDVYHQMFWHGRDQAEKIKYFIKKAFETWHIKYVLLVGGRKDQSPCETWWIPVRYSHLDRKYEPHVERKFISDLYFADIYDENGNFSSWDTNGNGIYGEWPEDKPADDIADLYPDVYVGRLTCRNAFEVRVIVKKIINYETAKYSGSWFKRMVVVAGDTYPDKTDYLWRGLYTDGA